MKHVAKKTVIGHTRKGRPIFQIAGGSGDFVPPAGDPNEPAAPGGDTITVADDDRPPTGTEEPPATPAPNRAVDPNAFNRGFEEQQRAGEQPTPGQTTNPATGRVFTEAEVEKIRQQEKDKLYGELNSTREELRKFREEREAEQRAREEEEARRIAEAEKAGEEDMDVRALIEKKEREWDQRFNEVQESARQAEALLEQERKYNALQEYKRQQIQAHEEDIMPHLVPYVTGNSEEEIQASIQQQIETTNAILNDIQQAQQHQRQQVPTTRVTNPGEGGPLEQQTQSTRTYSAAEIAAMSPAEFAAKREQLLGAAGRMGPYGNR